MKANELPHNGGESLLLDERAKSVVKWWDQLVAANASTSATFT